MFYLAKFFKKILALTNTHFYIKRMIFAVKEVMILKHFKNKKVIIKKVTIELLPKQTQPLILIDHCLKPFFKSSSV